MPVFKITVTERLIRDRKNVIEQSRRSIKDLRWKASNSSKEVRIASINKFNIRS